MIQLRVPGSLRYRNLVLRVVSEACNVRRDRSSSSLTSEGDVAGDAFLQETVTAVGEAFNNIAIHGYAAGQPDLVELQIEAHEDDLVVRIIDHGRSFDPGSVPVPRLDSLPESGMGLFIIRSFMDDVSYEPGKPNVLAMTKHRHKRDQGTGERIGRPPFGSAWASLLDERGGNSGGTEGGGSPSALSLDPARTADGTGGARPQGASRRSGFRMRSGLLSTGTGSSRQK